MSVPQPLSLPSFFLGTENVTLKTRTGEGLYTSYFLSGAKLMPSEDVIDENSLGGRGNFIRDRQGTWILWGADLISGTVPMAHPRPGDQVIQSGFVTWTITDVTHRPFVSNYFCKATYPFTSG